LRVQSKIRIFEDKPLRIPYTSGKRRHVQSRGVLWIGNIRCQYINPLAKKEHPLAESLNPCRRTRKRAKYRLGHACDWSTWRGARNDVQFLRVQNHSYVFGQYTLLLHFLFRILYTLSGSWGEPSIVRLEALHSSYLLEQGFTLFRPSP
jgi:hypothetical protein